MEISNIVCDLYVLTANILTEISQFLFDLTIGSGEIHGNLDGHAVLRCHQCAFLASTRKHWGIDKLIGELLNDGWHLNVARILPMLSCNTQSVLTQGKRKQEQNSYLVWAFDTRNWFLTWYKYGLTRSLTKAASDRNVCESGASMNSFTNCPAISWCFLLNSENGPRMRTELVNSKFGWDWSGRNVTVRSTSSPKRLLNSVAMVW